MKDKKHNQQKEVLWQTQLPLGYLKQILQTSQYFLNMEGDVDYQQLADDMRKLSGAAFAAFNQFDSNGLDFTTKALVGSQDRLQKAIEILGFNPVGRKWADDPLRQAKTEGEMITTFDSLEDLTGKVMLPHMVQTLENEFGIGQVVIVKIAKQEKVTGDFTLMMPLNEHIKNPDLIALYATQVGLYLDRVLHVKNLKLQRQRLTDIIEGTNVGTWEWNVQTGVMVINERWAQILGYSINEVGPINLKTWKAFLHPDDNSKIEAQIQQVFTHEKDFYDIECRMKHREGHWVWVYDRGKVVAWTDEGKPLVMSGTHTDITEKKQAQEALANSEQLYRAYMDKSPLAIFVSDQEGHYLRANKAACKLSGYTEEELKKLTIMDLTPPEFRDKEKAGSEDIDLYGIATAEFVGLKKNGDRYWGRLHASRINATETIGFVEDITERKAVETALAAKQKELETYFSSSLDLLCISNLKGEFLRLNPEWEKVLGYSLDELIGKPFMDYVHPEDIAETREAFQNLQKQEEVIGLVNRYRCKDQSYRWLEWRSKPVSEQVYAVARDITEQVLQKEELKVAVQNAEAANVAKSQFLANMSHEIRTPMNGILGFLQLLEETSTDQQQVRYIDYIKGASETLLALIDNILDLSKIESGKMELEVIPFDLRSTLDAAVMPLAHRAHAKKLILNLLTRTGMPHQVKGDPIRLRQIVTNLVSNAIKFTDAGSVTVECRQVEASDTTSTVEICISDTGIGISGEALHRLFEAFTQADATITRKFGGSGLGLSITRDLVHMMKGSITVDSTPGEGSIFTVTIPFEKDQTLLPDLASHKVLKGKHVYIVDGDGLNREIMRTYLEEVGCRVTEVTRGTEALEQLITFTNNRDLVSCIIIAQHLSGMSGEDLALALKAIPGTKEIPLCLFATVPTSGSAKKARDVGFAAYLSKPLSRREFLDTLASLLSGEEKPDLPAPFITRHNLREAYERQRIRVLVVEDQEVNRALAVQLLKNRGLNCDVAVNGLEAMAACKQENYDLVLMDIQMPVMDGLEATRQIRKLEGIKQPRIVAMTANAMKEDKVKCLEAGMDDYLSKPLDFSKINSLLQEGMSLVQDQYPAETSVKDDDLRRHSIRDLVKKTGFDKASATVLLEEGIIEWQKLSSKAIAALEAGKMDEVAVSLHQVVGSAANLRVDRLKQLAVEAEVMAKEEKVDLLKQKLLEIQQTVRELIREDALEK